MHKNIVWGKSIIYVIILTLLMAYIPFGNFIVHANEPVDTAINGELKNEKEEELTEKRTENSKTFLNPDGTFTTKISQTPLHFKDQKGDWKEINNDLVETKNKNEYTNKANDFLVKFQKEFSNGNQTVSLEDGDKEIHFSLESSTSDSSNNHNTKLRTMDKPILGIVDGDSITYPSAMKNTDVRYSVGTDRIKEDIVFKEKPSDFPDKFTYKMNLNGFEVKKEEDTIYLVDPITKEKLYYFDAPFMYDSFKPADYTSTDEIVSIPEEALSYDVQLDYELKGEELFIYVIPNKAWLNSPDRVYPLTIDPTIVRLQSTPFAEDTNIRSGFPTQTGGNDLELGAGTSGGNIIRSIVKFDLSSIPTASNILSSSLNLWFSSTNNNADTTVSMYKMKKDWEENQASWTYAKTQPFTPWSNKGGDFVTSNKLASVTMGAPGNIDDNTKKWNIPIHIVQDWLLNPSNNYGVMLKSDTEDVNYYKKFVSSEQSIAAKYKPLLSITYQTNARLGLEDYWQYDETSLVRGRSFINLTTGNNVMQFEDYTKNSLNSSINFIRSYNSKSNEDSYFGKGWSFNGSETLLEDLTTKSIIYTDADGTSTTFLLDINNNSYISPKGKYLKLTKNTNNITITDKYNNEYNFYNYLSPTDQSIKLYRIEYTKDNNENKTVYTYETNQSNKLMVITDPSENKFSLTYDSSGNKVIRSQYKQESYIYEYENNLLSKVYKDDKDNKRLYFQYDYDENQMINKVINPNKQETHFVYQKGYVSNIKIKNAPNENPNIKSKSYTYDIANNISTVIDEDSEVTYLSNDDFVPVKIIHDDGNNTEYKLDNNYNPLEIIEEDNTTQNKFDSTGNLLSSHSYGINTINEYKNNRIIKSIETGGENGNIINYEYDAKGNLLKIIDANEGTSNYEYDNFGNKTRISEPNKPIEKLEYTYEDTVIKTIDVASNKNIKLTYDRYNNLIASSDANGNSKNYIYDDQDNLISTIEPNEAIYRYNYDSLGRKVSSIDPKNNTEKYSYTNTNQLSSITDQLKNTTQINYSQNGDISDVTYPKGNKVSYEYNNDNKLNKVLWNNTTKWNLSYNSLGLLSKTISDTQQETNYNFDQNENLSTITTSEFKAGYSYNNDNLLTRSDYEFNKKQTNRSFSYNDSSQIDKIYYNNSLLSSYVYTNNRISNILLSNNLNKIKNFDATGVLTGEILKSSNNTIDSQLYSYDKNGNIIEYDNNSSITKYKYDEMNQLINEIHQNGLSITYKYDSNGNRIHTEIDDNGNKETKTYTYNAANQINEFNGLKYNYDQNGSLVNDGINEYDYDAENKLTSIKSKDHSKILYDYDYLGRRTKETIGNNTKSFFYEDDKLVLQKDQNQNIIEFLWNPDGSPLAMVKGEKIYFYNVNNHGDVVSIYDQNLNIVASYDYDAWGNTIKKEGSLADINPIRYASYYFDESTGLYYIGKRFYDPSHGRFLTRDNWLGNDSISQTQNKYIYANNNPILFTDPTGQYAIVAVPAAALALLLALAASPNVIRDLTKVINDVYNRARSFKDKWSKKKYLSPERKNHILKRHVKNYPTTEGKGTLYPTSWSNQFIFDTVVNVANKRIPILQDGKYFGSVNVFKAYPVIKKNYVIIIKVPYNAKTGLIASGYPVVKPKKI